MRISLSLAICFGAQRSDRGRGTRGFSLRKMQLTAAVDQRADSARFAADPARLAAVFFRRRWLMAVKVLPRRTLGIDRAHSCWHLSVE
jgi:hypothetical protein